MTYFQVCSTPCSSGKCFGEWTGEDECVHRLSNGIAAAYELGWEYAVLVEKSSFKFGVFVNYMHSQYTRNKDAPGITL